METLRVQLEAEKARKVREQAMKIYGHSKGSISKAMNRALDDWLAKTDAKKKKLTVDSIFGIASKVKIASVSKARKDAVYSMGMGKAGRHVSD